MSEDLAATHFGGRTYTRSKKNAPARGADDGTGAVQVKAAMSVSKWGIANYKPLRESDDGASEPKKIKIETKGEDPFSFDSEDKRKQSPVKKMVANVPAAAAEASWQSTRLPASRIVVKEEGGRAEFEEEPKAQVFRTYSRTTPKKPAVLMDQFVEVGAVSGKSDVKDEDSEEDFFPVQFRRDPIKTYTGEVVTPIDKPDSPPPQRKSAYKKKGGPRGRKPLTVSDPELIEEYKRNYAAQLLRGKPDTSTGGLNGSMVVSRKEVANEAQGTTLVVVCKPKSTLEVKGEVQAKYFTKSPKTVRGMVVPVASDSSSQELASSGETGNGESTPTLSSESPIPTRTSARLRNSVTTDSEHPSPTSTASSPACSPSKRTTRGRTSNADWSSPQSGTASSVSSDTNSQTQGKGGKRYRIFKSRTPQVEPDQTPENLTDESPLVSSEPGIDSTAVGESPEPVSESAGADEESQATVEPPSLTPENSQTTGGATEPEEMEADTEEDSQTQKPINATAARESLAARLRNMEKGNDSDSTEHDNLSECSENLQSQESPLSSQPDEAVQKEVSTVRKFFKSKKSSSSGSDLQRKIFSGSPQKSPAKATYNARSWHKDSEKDTDSEKLSSNKHQEGEEDIVLVKDSNRSNLKREVHWPETKFDEAYTSLRVNKKHKELYTVVHNVKQTHEVQELGETQDFMDDVDYLLDSLQDTKSTSIRCLSCLKLAGKCIMPAFRMHLRAHGTVTKIFSLLHDACSDPCLALSTSAMMFMMSRDRLNMDLDQDCLDLMLRLNEVDADKSSIGAANMKELEKIKQKVQDLLAQLRQETNAREIDLGFVSTGNLAMESLLSLTSRRAGEWFKEELRQAGGLDHIVDSVASCERSLPEQLGEHLSVAVPVLRKLDRCLRVLENISLQNKDNQNYLISYKHATFLASCTRVLRLCQKCMPAHKVEETPEENKEVKSLPGYTVFTCLLAILRVLLNITHEHKLGDFKGTDETVLLETILKCLTCTQWCIPGEQRFDLAVLCLGLLINLSENREVNCNKLMVMKTEVKYTEKSQLKTMGAVQAVVELFVQREEAAREMEEDTEGTPDTSTTSTPNKSGEWQESDSGIQWITSNLRKAKEEQEKQQKEQQIEQQQEQEQEEGNQSILEDDEETFTKALHKAGKHMENSIVASYAGLLLGTIIINNKDYAATVKALIPHNDFGPMIKMLKKFLNFMSLTTAFGSTDVNGITRVIEVLESA